MTSEAIDKLFEATWPSLKKAVEEAQNKSKIAVQEPLRSSEDMLIELLDRVRQIGRDASGDRSKVDYEMVVAKLRASQAANAELRKALAEARAAQVRNEASQTDFVPHERRLRESDTELAVEAVNAP